jgi:hypothetical protein
MKMEPIMKKKIQLLNAEITRHFYGFQRAVSWRSLTKLLVIIVNLAVLSASLHAQTPTPTPSPTPTLYVSEVGGTFKVGEYNATTGAAINANFITGLNYPTGLAVSGNILFVASRNRGTVEEYNATTGAAI